MELSLRFVGAVIDGAPAPLVAAARQWTSTSTRAGEQSEPALARQQLP